MTEIREEIKAEVMPAASAAGQTGKTKIMHRGKLGLFQRKPKPPTPAEAQRAIASKLTEPLDETGATHAEQVLNAQLAIAKDTSIDRGTGATKAAEFVFKAAGMLAPNPAPQQEKPLIVIIHEPQLFDKDGNERPILREEDRYVKPSQPSWAKEPPLLEGEFTTNPATNPTKKP